MAVSIACGLISVGMGVGQGKHGFEALKALLMEDFSF